VATALATALEGGIAVDSAVVNAAPPAATPVEQAFIDLVCQDEQLLRAEFDALIAASWQTPRRPVPPAPPRRPPPFARRFPAPPAGGGPAPVQRVPDDKRWRRQRAPP
jgi:hypothetical protein